MKKLTLFLLVFTGIFASCSSAKKEHLSVIYAGDVGVFTPVFFKGPGIESIFTKYNPEKIFVDSTTKDSFLVKTELAYQLLKENNELILYTYSTKLDSLPLIVEHPYIHFESEDSVMYKILEDPKRTLVYYKGNDLLKISYSHPTEFNTKLFEVLIY